MELTNKIIFSIFFILLICSIILGCCYYDDLLFNYVIILNLQNIFTTIALGLLGIIISIFIAQLLKIIEKYRYDINRNNLNAETTYRTQLHNLLIRLLPLVLSSCLFLIGSLLLLPLINLFLNNNNLWIFDIKFVINSITFFLLLLIFYSSILLIIEVKRLIPRMRNRN